MNFGFAVQGASADEAARLVLESTVDNGELMRAIRSGDCSRIISCINKGFRLSVFESVELFNDISHVDYPFGNYKVTENDVATYNGLSLYHKILDEAELIEAVHNDNKDEILRLVEKGVTLPDRIFERRSPGYVYYKTILEIRDLSAYVL